MSRFYDIRQGGAPSEVLQSLAVGWAKELIAGGGTCNRYVRLVCTREYKARVPTTGELTVACTRPRASVSLIVNLAVAGLDARWGLPGLNSQLWR